jgi:hypothetical protein
MSQFVKSGTNIYTQGSREKERNKRYQHGQHVSRTNSGSMRKSIVGWA